MKKNQTTAVTTWNAELIGAIHGLMASYGVELSMHAGAISEQHQQAVDITFTVLSIIPAPSTGVNVADYLISVASGQSQDVIASLDDSILTDDEISRISTRPRDVGKEKLMASIAGQLFLSPEQQADIGESADETIANQYDTIGNLCTNKESTGEHSIFKPGEDSNNNTGSTTRMDMP